MGFYTQYVLQSIRP